MISEPTRRRLGWLLVALGAGAAGVALWAVVGRGLRVHLLGLPLSARDPLRPAIVAFLSLAAGLSLVLRGRRIGAGLERLAPPGARAIAAAAGLALLATGLQYGVRAAGGADAYGYVSQAQLWLDGSLHVPHPFAATLPWPNADWSVTPLGYRPAANHTSVPTYAPGLPLLMAAAQLVGGPCGPFLVPVLCGTLLVFVTYALGARVADPVVGGVAALCVATSPTVVYMTLWTMSDVPAALAWTASLVVACGGSVRAAAASGGLAGLAILVRPNLVPLTLFPLLVASWPPSAGGGAGRGARIAAFGLASVPFALAIAWVNDHLYGSPLVSGYDTLESIYAWGNAWPNLTRYPAWLRETQTVLVFIFPAALIAGGRRGPNQPPLRVLLLIFVGAVYACYLWYRPFGDWWYLRFLLPAFPALFVLAADAVWFGCERLGATARVTAMTVFAGTVALHGASTVARRDILDIGRGEQKYADAGRYVERHLPRNAVVIAMQHSGSVRLYAGRTILRYDQLRADWLDRAVAYLHAQARPVYFLLEDWELPEVRGRFPGQRTLAVLDAPALARHFERDVALYAVTVGSSTDAMPAVMPATAGCALYRGE